MKNAAVLALAISLAPLAASARQAVCRIEIDRQTYVDGRCDYLPTGPDVQIGGLSERFRFYIERQEDGGLAASWNAGRGDAIVDLGAVTRRGGCWIGDRVRICVDERAR